MKAVLDTDINTSKNEKKNEGMSSITEEENIGFKKSTNHRVKQILCCLN